MYEALLKVLVASSSETEIQTAYLSVIQIDLQPSQTFLVYATDMFRRLSVNDQPITAESIIQRGCPRKDWAEAIVCQISTNVANKDQGISFEQWLLRLAKVSKEDLHTLFHAMSKSQYGHKIPVSYPVEKQINEEELCESDLEPSNTPRKTKVWCRCWLCGTRDAF